MLRPRFRRAGGGGAARSGNDSVLILAALAHAEDNDQQAIDLLTGAGLFRIPGSTAYARDLAHRLGVTEAYTAMEQECQSEESLRIHGPLGIGVWMGEHGGLA